MSEKREEKCSCAFCPGEFVKIKDAVTLIQEKKATFLSNEENGGEALLINGTKKARQFSLNWFIRMENGQFVVRGWPWKDGGDDVVTIHPIGFPKDCYIVPLCMIERYYGEVEDVEKEEDEEKAEKKAPARKKRPTPDYLFLRKGDRVKVRDNYPADWKFEGGGKGLHCNLETLKLLYSGFDAVVEEVFADGVSLSFWDGDKKMERLTWKAEQGGLVFPFWCLEFRD